MPSYVERPTILTLNVKVPPQAHKAFVDWQGKFNSNITAARGFVSLEFINPTASQDEWVVVQRFADPSSAEDWNASPIKNQLIANLKSLATANEVKEKSDDIASIGGGITEIFIAKIENENQQAFREWSARIHQAEARFPGFRGVYLQSPQENKAHWITLLQFDTMEHLDNWLESSERKKLIKESENLFSALETHRVISPYAGWFASIAKVGALPALWKQTMIILLVLFPIVMLEFKYLNPHLKGLDISLATFIGNAISVSLISFPMMPLAIRLLKWWLVPKPSHHQLATIAGTILVVFLYVLEIIIFWNYV